MSDLNNKKVKEMALDFGFAARCVIQQLSLKDATPEGLEAARILTQALNNAKPDANGERDAQ